MDLTKQSRKYTEKYTATPEVSTAAGVKRLLRDRHTLTIEENSELLTAINSAKLSEKQTEAIAWVYGIGASISQTARIMSMNRRAVLRYLDEAVTNVAKWKAAIA